LAQCTVNRGCEGKQVTRLGCTGVIMSHHLHLDALSPSTPARKYMSSVGTAGSVHVSCFPSDQPMIRHAESQACCTGCAQPYGQRPLLPGHCLQVGPHPFCWVQGHVHQPGRAGQDGKGQGICRLGCQLLPGEGVAGVCDWGWEAWVASLGAHI
jgi:hypothetical protein